MRLNFVTAVAAPTVLIAHTAAQAATLGTFTDGDFDFGARNVGPRESSVSLQAVSEIREDGSEFRACTMSTFKDGRAVAYPGAAYDAQLASGVAALEAIGSISEARIDRDSYRIDAAYIVVADSNEGEDFVRINVGAPQQEEARVFIGDQEIDPSLLIYEYSERAGHPDRAAESYTIKIEDPAAIAQVKDALATQEEITVIPRSVLNGYIIPATFVGNMDISEEAELCQTNLDEMPIARGTFPSWTIGSMLSNDEMDVLALAAMLEDEDALANPELFQIANVLATEGMFAVGPHVLQQMLNGEVVETSMGEYQSYNHLTGVMTVSPSMLQFVDHEFNSCSCSMDFLWPDTPDYTTPLQGTGTPINYASLVTGGGTDSYLFGGGGRDRINFDDITTIDYVADIPEWVGRVVFPTALVGSALLLGAASRRQKSSSEVASENAATMALEA